MIGTDIARKITRCIGSDTPISTILSPKVGARADFAAPPFEVALELDAARRLVRRSRIADGIQKSEVVVQMEQAPFRGQCVTRSTSARRLDVAWGR